MGWHMNSNWDEVPDGHDPNYVLAPTADAIAEGGKPLRSFIIVPVN